MIELNSEEEEKMQTNNTSKECVQINVCLVNELHRERTITKKYICIEYRITN